MLEEKPSVGRDILLDKLEEIRLNLKEFEKNRERLKSTPKFELTQELFEELFFKGWNKGYRTK
jgi:hypothetical protein